MNALPRAACHRTTNDTSGTKRSTTLYEGARVTEERRTQRATALRSALFGYSRERYWRGELAGRGKEGKATRGRTTREWEKKIVGLLEGALLRQGGLLA